MFKATKLIPMLLLVLVYSGAVRAQESEAHKPPDSKTFSRFVIGVASSESVRFTCLDDAIQMRLEVFDQSGQRVFDSNIKRSNLLDWNIKDRQKQHPAETTYICIITVIDISGQVVYKAGVLSLEQPDVILRQLDKSRLSSGQLQALEARMQSQSLNVEGGSELVILKAGETTSGTLLAHDGSNSQLVMGNGALSVVSGDLFANRVVEHMRLTAEGNLGIGTPNPQARLDVSGMIRTSGGIIFPDGSVQTTAVRLFPQSDSDGNRTRKKRPGKGGFVPFSIGPIDGMGTVNQIAMFTGANEIGDSVISQNGSNIGIDTSLPVSKLHIGVAPTATADYGTISLGSGPFDGTTSDFFDGSSSGTSIAVNEDGFFAGNLLDLQTAGKRRLAVNSVGSLGVQGTTPDSNIGVKIDRSGAFGSALQAGVYSSINTSSSSGDVYGARFFAKSSTSGGLPDHPFTIGVSAQGAYSGSGRLDFSIGTESLVANSGSGTIQDAYATFTQILNGGSGPVGNAYGSYNDVVNVSSSSAIGNAIAFRGQIRNFNAGGITTAYGLNLSNWTKGSGSVGTSYGIYMDNSIDLGTTRYALYSSSTSNSYFAGNVGIGTSTPLHSLDIFGGAASQVHLTSNGSSNGMYLFANGGDAYYIGGATFDGSQWVAKSTAASVLSEASGSFVFYGNTGLTSGSAFTPTERVRIDSAGSVGIGTSSPSAALHVIGDFIATGTKSAIVPVSNKRMVTLYAVESPENWFEDFGTGKLIKGVAKIDLDPTFMQTVNTGMDYHVFLTPNGNCRGLYVAEKTATGFRVRELRGGKSNTAFDYKIVARRKGYEDLRLQELPISTPKQ